VQNFIEKYVPRRTFISLTLSTLKRPAYRIWSISRRTTIFVLK